MPAFKTSLRISILIANLLLVSFYSIAQKPAQSTTVPKSWITPYEPFRIVGNLYYVGTDELACYFITTPQGNILINTGSAQSVPMIRSSVEALGFKFSDIKILLATHAHHDHVGGMATIKKMTGAKMMIEAHDATVLADGGNSDYLFGGKGTIFEPVKADRSLHDHDTIKFGGMQIIVLHHPGHTKGASSFLFDVKDESHSYRVLIANIPSILDETKLSGMSTYPDVAKDYGYTLEAMKSLQFDLWLASHASQFKLQQKHKPGDTYNPEAFRDQKGYDSTINDIKNQYFKRLSNN
jgi:metallo-beta-lactamase class B